MAKSEDTRISGKVIDLDRHIGDENQYSRIDHIGIELEGGWTKLPKGMKLEHDGSVEGLKKKAIEDPPFLTGNEIASPPMFPISMPGWVKRAFPQSTNETCGLHVHFSFKDGLDYQRLLTPDLTETTVEYLSRWGKKAGIPAKHSFWARIEGKKEHCQRIFWGDRQVSAGKDNSRQARQRVGHRYTIWNYPFKHIGTAECRVLPMFDTPEVCIEAIWYLISIVNSFLLATAKKEEKFKVSAPIDEVSLHKEILNQSLEGTRKVSRMLIGG